MIVINNSWKLAPWADLLYACDLNWWRHNFGVISAFPGLKVTQDPAVPHDPKFSGSVHRVKCNHAVDKLEVATYGEVGWGGNSGFQAINLAVQFGAKKIVLVGYDMRVDRGLHWHPDHPRGMHNPTARNVERWRRVTDGAAELLRALKIEMINASAVSSLRAYPKMSLAEALNIGAEDEVGSNQHGGRRSDEERDGVLDRRRDREQRPQADL